MWIRTWVFIMILCSWRCFMRTSVWAVLRSCFRFIRSRRIRRWSPENLVVQPWRWLARGGSSSWRTWGGARWFSSFTLRPPFDLEYGVGIASIIRCTFIVRLELDRTVWSCRLTRIGGVPCTSANILNSFPFFFLRLQWLVWIYIHTTLIKFSNYYDRVLKFGNFDDYE